MTDHRKYSNRQRIASAFNPINDSAFLVARYQQGKGITVTGTGVSTWADQSGNGNDLTQTVDANRPTLNADGQIEFNGTSDSLLSTNNFGTPVTFYLSFELTGGQGTFRHVVSTNGGGNLPFHIEDTNRYNAYLPTGVEPSPAVPSVVGQSHVASWTFGPNTNIEIDRKSFATGTGSGEYIGIHLGSSNNNTLHTPMIVRELIIYGNIAHSRVEQREIQKYLEEKIAGDFINPLSISDSVCWLRQGIGLTTDVGISQWDDASGNNNHMTQATGTKQPTLDGSNALVFDGIDDFMKIPVITLSGPVTYYIVAEVSAGNTDGDIMIGGNFASHAEVRIDIDIPEFVMSGNFNGADYVVGQYTTHAVVFDRENSVSQIDAQVITGDVGNTSVNGISLGCRSAYFTPQFFGKFKIKSFIAYKGAHSKELRDKVIAYLNSVTT